MNKVVTKKNIKITKIIIFLLLCICLSLPGKIVAEEKKENLVNIYFFHSNSCSHCQSESKLLDLIEKDNKNVKIYRYEIHEEKNSDILEQIRNLYQIKETGVPITIIGNKAYTGYSEEKSKLKFIKTIKYFSEYGYRDEVGELLQIDSLPRYEINKNDPTLEEFMNYYGNYKLIGKINTDDLDINMNAIILGILSKINIVFFISLLIVIIILHKIRGEKNKILLISFYLLNSFLLFTTYILSNPIYTLSVEIILLIMFMMALLGYSKNKKRQFIIANIFIIIAIISNYLENEYFGKNVIILKKLLSLYNLTGFNKIIYYLNFLIAVMFINVLWILLFQFFIKKNR